MTAHQPRRRSYDGADLDKPEFAGVSL